MHWDSVLKHQKKKRKEGTKKQKQKLTNQPTNQKNKQKNQLTSGFSSFFPNQQGLKKPVPWVSLKPPFYPQVEIGGMWCQHHQLYKYMCARGQRWETFLSFLHNLSLSVLAIVKMAVVSWVW